MSKIHRKTIGIISCILIIIIVTVSGGYIKHYYEEKKIWNECEKRWNKELKHSSSVSGLLMYNQYDWALEELEDISAEKEMFSFFCSQAENFWFKMAESYLSPEITYSVTSEKFSDILLFGLKETAGSCKQWNLLGNIDNIINPVDKVFSSNIYRSKSYAIIADAISSDLPEKSEELFKKIACLETDDFHQLDIITRASVMMLEKDYREVIDMRQKEITEISSHLLYSQQALLVLEVFSYSALHDFENALKIANKYKEQGAIKFPQWKRPFNELLLILENKSIKSGESG
jgi:hypothetical protein